MTLAPLTTGPHVVPANRLAFTTPVREAGGAGHWITLHSAEDPESGTCHVWVNGGSGPGSGTIGKGPKSLVGKHIAALASHPSVSKAQHHPVGHEPPGARDHPHYAEAQPGDRRQATGDSDGELAKRPGKPYARLSGADQGTRAEQIGKALSEAQGAAKGAKAAQGQDKVADTAVAHQQAQADLAAHRASADRNPNPWAPHLSPPVGDAKDRELAEKATRAQLAHQAAQAQQIEAAHQRLQQQAAQPRDQAQPVVHSMGKPGESDDEREQRLLAEHKQHKGRFDKVFRAEMGEAGHKERRELVDRMNAIGGEVQDIRDKRQKLGRHAQGAQQAEQTEGQRAHEKEMVRLKAETAQSTAETKSPAKVRPSKPTERPWDYISPTAQKRMDAARAEQSRKKADEDRRNLEGALIHNASYAHHAFTRDRAQSHAAMQDRLMAEHREKHGDEANRKVQELMDTARYAGRRYEGMRNASELVRQDVDAARQRQQQPKAEPKPAFSAPLSAPQSKEKPQTAPQPEQPAGAPAPSPQHRQALRDGRRLLAQKALDPEVHKAKVDAAVHKATAADAFGGARVGYARHGSEYAQRLAHLEAASHYQNHADALQRQHLALTNQDTGGALAKAQRHIEVLTHHDQRTQGQTHPESDQQARALLARSQAIGRHYTSAVQHLNAKAQEHRDAHARLRRTQPVRESATRAPRFSTPAAR